MGDTGARGAVTLWHHAFYQLVIERGPPSSEVRTEVALSQHPSRADLVLLRRPDEPRRDDEARVLRGLWPRLSEVSIVDFKSPTREFRTSELMRLMRYGMEYHELNPGQPGGPGALTRVLIVPRLNKALRDEIALLRCELEPLGGGYARLSGPLLYATYIVFLDEVAEAEHDEYLRIFTKRPGIRDPGARRWIEQWLVGARNMQNTEDMEGYDELLSKLLESVPPSQRLAGLTPEQVLAAFTPEQVLAAFTPEQRLMGLRPEQRLAGLRPEQRLAGLTAEQREILRALLSRRDGN